MNTRDYPTHTLGHTFK